MTRDTQGVMENGDQGGALDLQGGGQGTVAVQVANTRFISDENKKSLALGVDVAMLLVGTGLFVGGHFLRKEGIKDRNKDMEVGGETMMHFGAMLSLGSLKKLSERWGAEDKAKESLPSRNSIIGKFALASAFHLAGGLTRRLDGNPGDELTTLLYHPLSVLGSVFADQAKEGFLARLFAASEDLARDVSQNEPIGGNQQAAAPQNSSVPENSNGSLPNIPGVRPSPSPKNPDTEMTHRPLSPRSERSEGNTY
jgi:hypothetical protein